MMSNLFQSIAKTDPAISEVQKQELFRQRNTLELTASANYASPAVLEAQGFVFTNKASSGTPGKRFYPGCENIDTSEQLANERAKQLFQGKYANVQPHSGSQCNLAITLAFLEPGDTFMAMSPNFSGHGSHGARNNVSGSWFNPIHYDVNRQTECLDYEDIKFLAKRHRPKLIFCGSSAYSRKIDFAKFREIADDVGAYLIADIAHIAGLVATGNHPNPVSYCDAVTMTTYKTLRGPKGGLIVSRDQELGLKIDQAVYPGLQSAPLQNIIAAKAVAFGEALQPNFKTYSRQVIENARALSMQLQQKGFRIVSGSTENHLMVVDLSLQKITGLQAEQLLSSINILTNKNPIPFDPMPMSTTSGLRLGSAAMTTRGMRASEFVEIADIVADRLLHPTNLAVAKICLSRVAELCKAFPLYPELI